MNIGSMLNLSLSQKLSQSQILFLQLLTMTNQEIDQFLEKEYMENPLLERNETAVSSFKVDYTDRINRRGQYNDVDEYDVLMNIPQPAAVDLHSLFLEQLDRTCFSDEEWRIINLAIDNLDENGYLDDEMLNSCINDEKLNEMVDRVLTELKELEPAGCFARDISECLKIQLKRKNETDENLEMIVDKYFDDLLNQRVSYIAKELKISVQQMRKYISQISELDPKPLSGFNVVGQTSFVIPDIICFKENDEWKIELNTGMFDGYCLSDYYYSIMQGTENKELRSYFKTKMTRVKMIMDNIEQRRNMIVRLMKLLLETQADFFEGKGKVHPFTMAYAAELLEVSPSTITRTVKNKWIQYPGGTIPIKSLFTVSVSDKADCSADKIKDMLADFVKKEDPKEPYSDFKLVEMLEKEGLKISRRTVAKYRSELGIQSCYARRYYA